MIASVLATGLALRAPPPRMAAGSASVVFVVPNQAATSASPFGATSPEPNPTWHAVGSHLSSRLSSFDKRVVGSVLSEDELIASGSTSSADIIIALGLSAAAAAPLSVLAGQESLAALVSYDCASEVGALTKVGAYTQNAQGVDAALQQVQTTVAPWAAVARGERLCEQASMLLSRHSSEDLLYSLFFMVHGLGIAELDLVKHTVNPTWEKGPVRNAAEFASMCTKCADKIGPALNDPETKATIDLLNACDMRDQVGSYRVIVSSETPQLEEFSLCILQQNNCFGCDATIIDEPRVPLLQAWRGSPVSEAAARQIAIGHYDCDQAHPEAAQRLPWSWKIVCGANPAYDAFPAQHQIFYPSDKSSKTLWYDPVFKVETLDGQQVWTKRHYRCSPRTVAPELAVLPSGDSHGAWTLSTLDNGVVSKEHWTTVDAADDLSWAVFHYSGAAAVVGQSYLGGLLCSADGEWPAAARSGPEYERIRTAFAKCDIELWELYGHGPAEEGTSFMWTAEHAAWEAANPPPLDPIGDQSVQAWRKSEKEKLALQA